MKIALVQMSVIDGHPVDNLNKALELIENHPGAHLYLLPELWATGYARKSWQEYVKMHHAKVMDRLCLLAAQQTAWIGGSYIVIAESGRLHNRFILVSPQGIHPDTYDKVRLFAMLEEDKHLAPGSQRVNTHIAEWPANLSICFDLRFPIAYRESALEGAELFLIPAQWPQERCHQMVAIARARAIENQAYVALCNRIGSTQKGLMFGGQSGIWAPDGSPLSDAADQECVMMADINRETVHKLRKELPFLVP